MSESLLDDAVAVAADDMIESEEAPARVAGPRIMLDPAVELLGIEINGYRLLVHGELETGLAVPPGDGLVDLLNTLFDGAVAVEALHRAYSDRALVDAILATLLDAGFAHSITESAPTDVERTALLNAAVRRRAVDCRRSIDVDLDAADALVQLDALDDRESVPELVLRCTRLADHRETLARLAARRRTGAIRLFDVAIRTADPACDQALARSILGFGAAVIVEDVAWPAPAAPIAGLDELTRQCVAVHVVMSPDGSILEAATRAHTLDWASSVFISGLRLRLDPAAIWPDGADDAAFATLFDIVQTIEDEFGDILVETLPSDEALLGLVRGFVNRNAMSDFQHRFRRAYLRHRMPLLKAAEGDNLWSQIPEVEDKLVRIEEDLLPNHPELLGLVPGSRVVDVCGGLGRVARRLSPMVGPDGLIVSIEMLRLLSTRARSFASERGFANLSFRPGLAQRLPLPDATMDAAVNEWTGGIWELGIGPAMLREMARVVRPGGRVAVTHRLVRLPFERLAEPWVQYDRIYDWIREAFDQSGMAIVTERIWGQVAPTLIGENATLWRKQYVRSIINPFDFVYQSEDGPGKKADVFLTIVAEVPK